MLRVGEYRRKVTNVFHVDYLRYSRCCWGGPGLFPDQGMFHCTGTSCAGEPLEGNVIHRYQNFHRDDCIQKESDKAPQQYRIRVV